MPSLGIFIISDWRQILYEAMIGFRLIRSYIYTIEEHSHGKEFQKQP